jgi:Amt family ammonium transporter
MTALICLLLKAVLKIRVTPSEELSGIDVAEHAEVAYDLSNVRYTAYRGFTHAVVIPASPSEATVTAAAKEA